ncbi:MAG: hypothetical protein EU539_12475 [Promethearchaeota archaeon]|nr:MAG: hypothetical protein EU539_12475 [Candidatus Lokiarchaeota archaeon]
MGFKTRLIIYLSIIGALVIIFVMSGLPFEQVFALMPELLEDTGEESDADFIFRLLRLFLTGILIMSAILEVIFKIKSIKSLEQDKDSGRRRRGRLK